MDFSVLPRCKGNEIGLFGILAKLILSTGSDSIGEDGNHQQCLAVYIYCGEPFYSFARNEIKRGISGHGYEIKIAATFPKDMPQEKARKIMKDRVAKWKAEQEGL